MAHPDGTIACVDRAHVTPGLAVVFADAKPRLFRIRIFAASVVAEGGIKPPLVEAKRHAMEKAVAVPGELVWLDDGEPRILQHGQLGGLKQRLTLIPERRRRFSRRQCQRREQQRGEKGEGKFHGTGSFYPAMP